MEPAPPETPRLSWPAEWRCPAISAALLLAAVLLIHPVVEMGMNDDWSYIHVARGLALQGRLIYHGWAEPTMIPQAFWGALFFKALGFSFTAARISTVVLALLLVPVLYALGREAGLKPAFANFATLVVILCPVFLPEAVSFMTDVPSFFFSAVCLYAALRSAKAEGDRACWLWGFGAGAFGILAGMTRQLCWAAPLWMLAAAAWRQRRRRPALALLATWLATAAACATTLIWYYRQEFVPRPDLPLVAGVPSFSTADGVVFLMETLAVLSIPVAVMLIGTSWRIFPRKRWIAAAVVTLAFAAYYESTPWHRPPRLFNTISEFGLLFNAVWPVRSRQLVLVPAVRIAIGVMAIACAAASFAVLVRAAGYSPRVYRDRDLGPFLLLAAPYAAAVVFASVIRTAVFDRYLIPVLPLAIILMLWVYQREPGRRVPLVAWALVALYAAFGVAITHDAFASARARLQAAEPLLAIGIPPSAIMVGLEYDAWAQLELNGHVNDPRVQRPNFAYRLIECTGPRELQLWYREWLPDLRPRYFVADDRLRALVPLRSSQVTYRRWLPPVERQVSTYTLPDQSALQCY